jgi:hypothetical protein
MSFKDNVNLHVDKSAKLLNFSDDLLEHLKSTHSLKLITLLDGERFTQSTFFQLKVD